MGETCYAIEVRCDCQTDYECGDSWCICVTGSLETAKEYVREIETSDPVYMARDCDDVQVIVDEVFDDGTNGFYRSIRYKDQYDEWHSRIYVVEMDYLS